MPTGTVLWFSAKKGYRFITADEAGPDVFVHVKTARSHGMADLTAGDRVVFEVIPSPGGRTEATNLARADDLDGAL